MKLLLISNSTNYKESYLGWCMPLIQEFLGTQGKKKIAFFPYAVVRNGATLEESYNAATEKVKNCFKSFGLKADIVSTHSVADPVALVNESDAIMVSGGNTFHLVYELHRNKLIEPVRRKVLEGAPYMGWSAGSNVACPTLRTTNDMPIIMPESFNCFDFVPFQINPHYIDPYPTEVEDALTHAGESRQDRIEEFLCIHPEVTVVGLREATALWVENDVITLREYEKNPYKKKREMIVLKQGCPVREIKPGSTFDFSMNLLKKGCKK